MTKILQEVAVVFAILFALTVFVVMLPYALRALLAAIIIIFIYRGIKYIFSKIYGKK